MTSNMDSFESLIAKEVTERSESKTISPSLDTECKAEANGTQLRDSIDSTKIFVISLGSLFLRLGRACDPKPKNIHNIIGRKKRSKQTLTEDTHLLPLKATNKELEKSVNECQKSIANVLNSCLTSSGRLRTASNTDVINNFNKRSKPIVLSKSTPNGQQWTQLKGNEDVLIGEEALYLKPGQPFHIRWPIRRGVLNVSNCLGGSLTSIIADLESICGKAIEKHFEISLKELNQYRVVLIIPDVYNRNHIKYMIEMLLNGLGFQSCLLIHEAVCATFGAGLSTACVVDVGHEKTSICCIEDGFGSRNTRLTLEYGGSDITQVFHYLLKQKSFPYECKPETRVGALFLEGLKQKLCHLNLDVCGHQETRFRVTVPEEPVLDYTILVGDECIIGPLGLFYPELFALTMNSTKRMRILYRNDGHSDDPFDENYLIQTKRKYGESNDNLGQTSESAAIEATIDDELDGCDVNPNVKEINSDQQLLGLDQAIVQCIDQCESDEVKRRMFGSILLCGGGLAFNGIDKYLRSRVSQQMPNQFRGQNVEIHVKPKDMDSQIVSWKGAAVLSLLDSAQEMWITSDEWTKSGIKLLREKASFVF